MSKQKKSTKYGNVYKLGDNLLLHGDSCDEELVLKFLKGLQVHLLISDPPFGIGLVSSKRSMGIKLLADKPIKNDHLQSEEEYAEFSRKWLGALLPFLAKKNSMYIFQADKMIFGFKKAMDGLGIYYSQTLVWVKSQHVAGRMNYNGQHESIIFSWYGTHKFYKKQDRSVIFCPKPQRSPWHPSTKPLSLVRRLILNSSRIGDTVLDPFGGSGTCLLSCEQTKRKCLMIEYDQDYIQTIIKRWEALTGKKAELVTNLIK